MDWNMINLRKDDCSAEDQKHHGSTIILNYIESSLKCLVMGLIHLLLSIPMFVQFYIRSNKSTYKILGHSVVQNIQICFDKTLKHHTWLINFATRQPVAPNYTYNTL